MEISAKLVKELRDATGAGMMDCKKALVETSGDLEKAKDYLRTQGRAKADKRADKEVTEGVVEQYIHSGSNLGVLVELNCETDFVAKTDDFIGLAKDIAMQIAAANPDVISREEVNGDAINREVEIYKEQARVENKPEKIIDRIAKGKLEKYYSEVCLMEQVFVKDSKKTIKELVSDAKAKLGENITVKRFSRFQIGG